MIVGIDLGTTNTVVTYQNGNSPSVLEFGADPFLPSAVYIRSDNSVLVGNTALQLGTLNPARLICSSKRKISSQGYVYPDSEPNKYNFDMKLTPIEVAEYILRHIKNELIQKELCSQNETINAVITVPAYFDEAGKNNTRHAGQNAGFNVLKLVSEPSAAAINYISSNIMKKSRIFVFDFGGGTLDFTILDYEPSKKVFEPIAAGGDNELGGDDIDNAICRTLFRQIKEETEIDLENYKSFINSAEAAGYDTSSADINSYNNIISRIISAARDFKHNMQDNGEYFIDILEIFFESLSLEYDLEMTLTSDFFNKEIFRPIQDKILLAIGQIFSSLDSHRKIISKDSINKVILVGGSSKLPIIRKIISRYIGIDNIISEDPAAAVAKGALKVATGSININNDKIGRLPVPHEILAMDFGVEASSDSKSGSFFDCISPRNSKLPSTHKKLYTTSYPGAPAINVNVYSRKSSFSPDDTDIRHASPLYNFLFTDYDPINDPQPHIMITFSHNADGTLSVSALNENNGSIKHFDMQNPSYFPNRSEAHISSDGAVPSDIILLLDASYSMASIKKGALAPIDQVKNAVRELVTNMIDMKTNRVGVISFSLKHEVVCELTYDTDLIIQKTNGITPQTTTNAEAAFKEAQKILEFNNSPGRRPVIIMLTDGIIDDSDKTQKIADILRKQGITIATIGAIGASNNFLKKISSKKPDGNSFSYSIDNFGQLSSIFNAIVNLLKKLKEEKK